MLAQPLISVVLPVRDGERYLSDSLDSILDQTLERFEVVVVDDGSRDGTRACVEGRMRRDDRVRLLVNGEPAGLSRSLNRGIDAAAAPLIARMDADDISRRDRLSRQWQVLQDHRDAVMVGTLWYGLDATGRCVRPRDRWRLIWGGGAPFPHGSIMLRKDAFMRAGAYREAFEPCEDVDLYPRLAALGRVLVVPEALYGYRFHVESMSLVTQPEALDRVLGRREWPGDPLASGTADPRDGHPMPASAQTLYYLSASRVWAGGPPTDPGRIRDAVSLLKQPRGIRTLLLSLAGRASPWLLRWTLGKGVAVRDVLAGCLLDGGPQEWRCV